MSLGRQMLISLGLVALMLAGSAWAWPRLPDIVAVHFSADGQANGWATKARALVILPGLTGAIAVLFAGLYGVLPERASPRRSPRAFAAVWTALLVLLAGVHGALILKALEPDVSVPRLIWLFLGVLYLVLGNVAGKIRHNFVFGVRTPWTLLDERVWDKTHRLFGWLSVLAGVGLIAIALMVRAQAPLAPVMVGLAIAPSLAATLYSWWISRGADPRSGRSAEGGRDEGFERLE